MPQLRNYARLVPNLTMELELSSNDESGGSSNGLSELKETIELALDDPRVEGLIASYLEQSGHDPSQFGLTSANTAAESGGGNPQEAAEVNASDISVEDVKVMLDKTADHVGWDTTLKEVWNIVESNPTIVQNILEDNV